MTGVKKYDWRDCIGQYKLYYLARSINVIAVLLCVLNVITGIVMCAFGAQVAALLDQAGKMCDAEGKDTERSCEMYTKAQDDSGVRYGQTTAVSQLLTAAVLLLMVTAFLIFSPACIVMFRRVERKLDVLLRERDHRTEQGVMLLPFEFSPPAADGSRVQIEMQVSQAMHFLRSLKSSAATQQRQLFACLVFILIALVALATLALLIVYPAFDAKSHDCGPCESCQSVRFLMIIWYLYTPEIFPLVSSLSTTLPLIFSLWRMTTREDRALMINPSSFFADAIARHSTEAKNEAVLRGERIRMGIDLL